MPLVRNEDVFVRYEEYGDPKAPAIVLIFGFGMSCLEWETFGYVNKLQNDYRLIAVEPRGHGESSKPEDASEYTLPLMRSDIAAVADHLALTDFAVWGYSLGAKIGLAFAAAQPKGVKRLILGGFEFCADVDPTDDVVSSTLREGAGAWLALWRRMVEVPPATAARLSQVDVKALAALRRAEADWPSLAAQAVEIAVPTFLYCGENCFFRPAMAEMDRMFPGCRYVERCGRDHFNLMLDSEWICSKLR